MKNRQGNSACKLIRGDGMYLMIAGLKWGLLLLFLSVGFAQQQNRLFWDGGDWKRIEKLMDYNPDFTYRVKAAYVNGVLDGRLFYYLKTWAEKPEFADSLYAETIDYLSTKELVRALDNFYADPLNVYIPVPSAMIIANMYGERVPLKIIDAYIQQTKFWINDLMYKLEQEGYEELLNEKVMKHRAKQPRE